VPQRDAAAQSEPDHCQRHTTIEPTTSRWRRILGGQPENTPPATAPAEIAATSSAIAVPPSTGPAETLMDHPREQSPRQAEDHRDQVDDERHQHDGAAREVGEAVENRA
jgi:hypothetical protein